MYPQTRDEYRAQIMQDVCKLISLVESDWNEHQTAEALARGLHYDVREYFNMDRWKPTPVYAGICTRVPTDQPLTLFIHHHDGVNGRQIVQGRITAIKSPYRPNDGAEFEIVPRGCRKVRKYFYWPGVGASLSVCAGWVEAAQPEGAGALYHHEMLPPVQT